MSTANVATVLPFRARRSHLGWLESEAIYFLREVAGECSRPALLFSGGKDSIVLLRLAEAPLHAGARLMVKHATRAVRARVLAVDRRVDMRTFAPAPEPSPLALNEIGRVALALQQPLPVDRYARNRATGAFILVDEATNPTVGAGLTA